MRKPLHGVGLCFGGGVGVAETVQNKGGNGLISLKRGLYGLDLVLIVIPNLKLIFRAVGL